MNPYHVNPHEIEAPKEHIGLILQDALKIINAERFDQYGRPEYSFNHIAKMWTTYLGIQITPKQVAIMMVLLKICREKVQNKPDNLIDAAGYLGIAGDL